MSRRVQIRMSDDEVATFLEQERTLACATRLGHELLRRYAGEDGAAEPAAVARADRQAPRRVALEFVERARATWDHRRLAAGAR